MGHGKRRRLTVLEVILVLAMTACKSTVRVLPQEPDPIEPIPYAVQLARAEHVTADKLYRIYSQDLMEGATPDQRFKNWLVHVTGVSNGINRRLPGKTYLELRTSDDSAFVYVLLAPDDPLTAAALTPGTPLKLLCTGAGMMMGSPLLKN